MAWTNSLNGAAGLLSVASPWSIANVRSPSAVNINTNPRHEQRPPATVTNAADGCQPGVRGRLRCGEKQRGSGFGAWQFYTSSTDGNLNSRFIANSAAVNISTPAWGL